MSRITTAAMRGALAVGLLIGVSAAGTASATAAVTPKTSEKYTCTASYPEVCLGVFYSGSTVTSEVMQANMDAGDAYYSA
jgi:hypothetical protein